MEHKKDLILPTSTSMYNKVRVGVPTTSTSTCIPNLKNDLHSSDSMYQCDIVYGCKVPNVILVSRFYMKMGLLLRGHRRGT